MNLPEKYDLRMQKMLGNEYADYIRALKEPPAGVAIRINTLKPQARERVLSLMPDAMRVPWCPDGYYCDKTELSGKHPYHMAGLFYFQEASAMAAVEAADIHEGERILDLCAAPGGKSTHAAAKLKGTGLLVSNELISKRARILSENIERMGITNAVVTNESPERLARKYPEFFDRVIVDAPCSGEGMFRREAHAVEEWSEEHSYSCAERQKKILACAIGALRQGGVLVYSTCTFSPAENEEIAAWLSQACGMIPKNPPALSMLDSGRNDWCECEADVSAARHLFPHHQRCEGHFVAVFEKPGEGESIPKRAGISDMPVYRSFEAENLNIRLEGCFRVFGNEVYLLPEEVDIERIKVVRCGLHLGTIKKNRFEPAHALALSQDASAFRQSIDFAADSREIAEYLRGGVLPCRLNGYCVVTVDGTPIGWGKASGGVLKNHYPKALRLPQI